MRGAGPEALIATRYDSTLATEEQRAYVLALLKGMRFAPRHCSRNARRLILTRPSCRVTYCEGILRQPALSSWLHHAWVVVDTEVVLELTAKPLPSQPWTDVAGPGQAIRGRPFGFLPAGWQYYGIAFDAHHVAKSASRGEHCLLRNEELALLLSRLGLVEWDLPTPEELGIRNIALREGPIV